MRIQQVTDDIAESLSIKPPHGALIAGVDDKGPAKPAGIQPGDVVVRFDGHDIKEMHDLSRVVADTPSARKSTSSSSARARKKTKKVKFGRLQDTDKVPAADAKKDAEPGRSRRCKGRWASIATLSKDLRSRYKIKDSVKGVIITNVDGTLVCRREAAQPGRGHRRGGAGGGQQRRRHANSVLSN